MSRIRKVYPRWLRRISGRTTLLEGRSLPITIVEDAKALAPDCRRLIAHVLELRRENLTLRQKAAPDA